MLTTATSFAVMVQQSEKRFRRQVIQTTQESYYKMRDRCLSPESQLLRSLPKRNKFRQYPRVEVQRSSIVTESQIGESRSLSPETILLLNVGNSADNSNLGTFKESLKADQEKECTEVLSSIMEDPSNNFEDDNDWPQSSEEDCPAPAYIPAPVVKKRTVQSYGAGPYTCSTCDLVFIKIESFKAHRYEKHSPANHMCEECGKSFVKPFYLKYHKNTHSKIKPYECDLCGKHFLRRHYLVLHMRSHLKVKKYFCQYCSNAYTFYSDWKRHESSHTGIYLYNCEKCKKGWNRKKQMNEHVCQWAEEMLTKN